VERLGDETPRGELTKGQNVHDGTCKDRNYPNIHNVTKN